VTEDGLLVSLVCVISSRSFDKKIIRKIMGGEYRESSSRVIAWDDTVLEMQAKNVRPVNGLFWGEPKVVRLRCKCTGTPTAVDKRDYPTEYKVRDKQGEWHVQCDCIVIVTVRKVEEQTQAELVVATSYVDLFGIGSSQSQRSDGPPSPPRRRRKKRPPPAARHKVDDDNDDKEEEEEEEDGDQDEGGGGGYSSDGGGKRKRSY
jgi:hypothetical protein